MTTVQAVNLTLLLVLDVPVWLLIGRLFFGSFSGFGDALRASWLLQWTFFWNSEWYNREVANFMVELYLGICGLLLVGELQLLHLW